MSTGEEDVVREVAREVLAELLPGLLEEALAGAAQARNGNGQRPPAAAQEATVPQVPAPPVAMVHRPSGWTGFAGSAVPTSDEAAIEWVSLRDDAALEAFVHALARRLESERERTAILGGRVRFRLASSAESASAAREIVRVESGAVTERAVKDASKAGARLVLSPRAVLTPMARDRARSLGVEIEKERACRKQP